MGKRWRVSHVSAKTFCIINNMKDHLIKYFDNKDINEAVSILNKYNGSESERVRKAVVKLSYGSIEGLKYYIECAIRDYRDVLYWAEYPNEAGEALKKLLGGMTVNERLFHLELFDQFDAAVKQKNKNALKLILKKCHLSDENIEEIIKRKFDTEQPH